MPAALTLADLEKAYLRDPDGLAERLTAVDGGSAALLQLLRDEAARDGWFWLKFVLTRDEADQSDSVKPFPVHLDYLRDLWSVFTTRNLVCIAKSRQMLVSWALAAFAVWTCRSRPHQSVYWQTQKEADAVGMVCGAKGAADSRCQFIEKNLPDWLRMPIRESEGEIVFPNGSLIQGLAGGAGQIRGKTASLIILDEFAHMEQQKEIWTSIAPLIQKGAKAFIVSTPNGSGNRFAELFHGRKLDEESL